MCRGKEAAGSRTGEARRGAVPAGWGRAWRSGWLVGDGRGAAFAEHVTLLHAPSSTPRGLRTRDWQHLCSLETRSPTPRPGPAGAKPAFQPTPRLFAWKEAVKRTPFHSVLARHPEALLDDTVGTQMPEPQSGGSPLPTAPVLPNSTPTLVTDLGIPRGAGNPCDPTDWWNDQPASLPNANKPSSKQDGPARPGSSAKRASSPKPSRSLETRFYG